VKSVGVIQSPSHAQRLAQNKVNWSTICQYATIVTQWTPDQRDLLLKHGDVMVKSSSQDFPRAKSGVNSIG